MYYNFFAYRVCPKNNVNDFIVKRLVVARSYQLKSVEGEVSLRGHSVVFDHSINKDKLFRETRFRLLCKP